MEALDAQKKNIQNPSAEKLAHQNPPSKVKKGSAARYTFLVRLDFVTQVFSDNIKMTLALEEN